MMEMDRWCPVWLTYCDAAMCMIRCQGIGNRLTAGLMMGCTVNRTETSGTVLPMETDTGP